MGRLGVMAIFQRNYPLIMGITVFSAVLIVLGNLLADVGYALADPRIRLTPSASPSVRRLPLTKGENDALIGQKNNSSP
jgi:hypothetical protein